MEGSSSKVPRSTRKRNDKGRRSWSLQEEEVLLAGLKEIVANGWKSENGFKVGYLQALEQYMIKAFPNTNIQAMPHINSRIHVWKKNYSSLFTMLSRSGVGYNGTTKMIECDDDTWDAVVKTDPNAKHMRHKSWPFYPDWVEIFGKDRATGGEAEDFVEAVNHVLNINDDNRDTETFEGLDAMFNGFNDETESMSVCQEESSAIGNKNNGGKKRKAVGSPDPIYELIGTFCKSTDTRLGDIAKKLGYEYDISNARKQVFAVVQEMVGLTLHEKLLVSKLLVKETEDLELFFSLPNDAKVEFAKMKLSGHL